MLCVDRAQNGGVGSSDVVEFCSFTKAIEHLGDRWSLLVVREIGVFGPQGFNTLARGLPGRISTSVLTERVRRLESLGVITHDDGKTGSSRYRLTAAGEALVPIIMGLRGWSAAWIRTTRRCWTRPGHRLGLAGGSRGPDCPAASARDHRNLERPTRGAPGMADPRGRHRTIWLPPRPPP